MKINQLIKAGIAALAVSAFIFSCTAPERILDNYGAVKSLRAKDGQKNIYAIFSTDSLSEGMDTILRTLKRTDSKASFFFTGNFLRREENRDLIKRIRQDGHYIGGHSDRHILYCDWDNNRTQLASSDSIREDLAYNIIELNKHKINTARMKWFLPPFEWHNKESVTTIRKAGLTPIALTPGILTYRDYTTPDMPEYRTTDSIINQLYRYETENTLDGAIIIFHPGTQPSRTDKLYNRLNEIIDTLTTRGYKLTRLP